MRKLLVLALAIYVGGYVALRFMQAEVWEGDDQIYVIFPTGAPWLYYLYRPLAYLDGQLTGMQFHIGPHQ